MIHRHCSQSPKSVLEKAATKGLIACLFPSRLPNKPNSEDYAEILRDASREITLIRILALTEQDGWHDECFINLATLILDIVTYTAILSYPAVPSYSAILLYLEIVPYPAYHYTLTLSLPCNTLLRQYLKLSKHA